MRGPWYLSEPDIEIRDGELHRTYHLVVHELRLKVDACALLCVAFWLAPRPLHVTVELWPRIDRR